MIFLSVLKGLYYFLLDFVNVVYQIYWFAYIELSLHLWDPGMSPTLSQEWSFLLFLLLLWDRVLFIAPGWTGTGYVPQAGLKLAILFSCLCLWSARITDVDNHDWLLMTFSLWWWIQFPRILLQVCCLKLHQSNWPVDFSFLFIYLYLFFLLFVFSGFVSLWWYGLQNEFDLEEFSLVQFLDSFLKNCNSSFMLDKIQHEMLWSWGFFDDKLLLLI